MATHQYSCLGNPTDRGSWRATVHGATEESDMTAHTHPWRLGSLLGIIELYSGD